MTNPSGRKSHWAIIRRERDAWIAAVICISRAKLPRAPLQKAKLTLTRHSASAPDPDGLVSGFKAIVDGLVRAKVLVNDRFENIGMPDYRWVKAAPKKGFIQVRVEGEENDAYKTVTGQSGRSSHSENRERGTEGFGESTSSGDRAHPGADPGHADLGK